MAQDPYRYFRLEARDLLDQASKAVLDLEKSEQAAPLVQRLLRIAHTLKGAARVVKQPEIADRAHAIEDVLSPFRELATAVPREAVDAVLRDLDAAELRLRELALPAAEAPAAAVQHTAPAEESVRTVRTDLAEIDAVLDGVAETVALLGGLRAAVQTVERTRHLAELAAERGTGGAVAEELRHSIVGLELGLGSTVDQMERELRQLRDAAEQLRLVSAETLFTSLERTARDAAQALGRHVSFEGKGGDVRLDARVLSTLQGALVQLVRNAVAHGIEPAAERRALGKPEAGRIAVAVTRRGRRIVFECRDDGRGLDLEAVRRTAMRRGLSGTEAARLGVEELVRLLLRGGISTADAVTEIAGRGVGLDVVREAVERLGGEVLVHTGRGAGTRFELVVQASLAAVETLLAESAGTVVALPLAAVRDTRRMAPGDIVAGPQGGTMLHHGTAVPFAPLSRLLHHARPPAGQRLTAVVVEGAGGVAAIGVERLLGTARVVFRPLPELAPGSSTVAGASLDAEGNPQLVLDPDGLVAAAAHADAVAAVPPGAALPVLVIDDSLTTRMLEQSILESAGYEVDTAVSAEEGIEIARRKHYALILVDVEMPGMDGFSFVETIRRDPALRDVPAILVTSRAAPEDRRRGREAGAQDYIVKSEFDQRALLETIRSLTGRS